MIRRYIGVVGAATATEQEERIAEEVGRLLGEQDVVVVTGGLGGVMAAACRGAKAAGGTTLAILPGEDRADANHWVDVAVPTGMGEARNAIVVRSSDAVIAIGGEFGTLSEIALALKLGCPVVGVETWTLGRRSVTLDPIARANDAAAAVELALRLL